MRLLTLNIQHGLAAVGTPGARRPPGRAALEAAADEIAEIRADVVLLQEVDKDQARSGLVDQTELLGDATALPHRRFAPSLSLSATGLRLPPRRLWSQRLPGYGVALLSRYPVRSWHVLRLPGAGLRLGRGDRLGWSLGGWYPVLDAGRVCLAAVLDAPGGPLTVATTHLSVDPPTARAQLRRVVDAVRALPGPHVVGGDLNLEPDDLPDTGLRALASAPTFTNARPRRQIDHLLGEGVGPAGPARAHHLSISDHAGLSTDLQV